MHILHVFGWTGIKRGYLDMPLAAAQARYAAETGASAGEPYEAITFVDSLDLYSAGTSEQITPADHAEALAATEVRADVTAFMTVVGLHAAARDLGRAVGALFAAQPPRPRGEETHSPWRLYVVTPRLAAALLTRGAAVTRYEGMDLWLRSNPSPLRDDPDLQAMTATTPAQDGLIPGEIPGLDSMT